MDWVKLYTTYPDDVAIATADDSGEVMFTRGIAYCGRADTGGFIPDTKLQDLTRRPARAKTIVRQLTRDTPLGDPGPWEKVTGGYRIRNWSHYQEQLDALAARRKNDRTRKAKQRATSRDTPDPTTSESRDRSRDSHTTDHVTGHVMSRGESKSKSRNAAAAAFTAAAAADEIPTAIAILRDKLQSHTALQALRFDQLGNENTTLLLQLIDTHGDARLVDTAVRTTRQPPPVHVAAFIGTWKAMPPPGQRLAVVKAYCTVADHRDVELRTDGTCGQCIVDAKVAEAKR